MKKNSLLASGLLAASVVGLAGCSAPLEQASDDAMPIGAWTTEAGSDLLTGEPTYKAARSLAVNAGQAELTLECPQFSVSDQSRLNAQISLVDSAGMPMELDGIDVASNTVPLTLNMNPEMTKAAPIELGAPVVTNNSVRFSIVVIPAGAGFSGIWTVFLAKDEILKSHLLAFDILANGSIQSIDLKPQDATFRKFIEQCSSNLPAAKEQALLEPLPESAIVPAEPAPVLADATAKSAPRVTPASGHAQAAPKVKDVASAIMATARVPKDFPAVSAPSLAIQSATAHSGAAFRPYSPSGEAKQVIEPAPGAINQVVATAAVATPAKTAEPAPVIASEAGAAGAAAAPVESQ